MIVLSVDSRYISPYALSAFVALTEKGVEFSVAEVDMEHGAHRAPRYADASGTARIPMLSHDGFHLSESSAIAEYLEDAFPPPDHARLYPAEIESRARARQLQAWVRSDLLPIRAERPTERVFVGDKLPPLTADARAAVGKLFSFADRSIPSDGGPMFGQWSIADTDLAVMLNRLVVHGDEVPEKLAKFARREWERRSVRAWRAKMER